MPRKECLLRNPALEETQVADGAVLRGNFLKRGDSKGNVGIRLVEDDAVVRDKLEVVKFALWQVVVKLRHQILQI